MSRLINRKLALICVVFLLTSIIAALGFAFANEPSGEGDPSADKPITIPIFADGILIGEGICIDGSTYVSLRLMCEMLVEDVEITWDQEEKTAIVIGPDLEITAEVGNHYFYANERYFYTPNSILNLNGMVMVPVRELANVFSVNVTWYEDWSISFDTYDVQMMENGGGFYNEDDVYWLSRIINAESGNQPLEGKIGTGNVVLNRVKDPTCPDNIYDVIFDRQHGVQFSPVETGSVYDEPNDESVIAAKLCLEGYSTVGDSLFFVNPEIGVTEWMNQTRTFVISIGDHDFYA